MVATALSWCGAFGLYLLFAGQLSASELGSAAALATLAAGWSLVVRRCGRGGFHGWRGHGRPVLRGLGKLLPATLRTGAMLLRVAARGGSTAKPIRRRFAPGGSDEPSDRARRATAVLLASLAPDSFVVRAAPEANDVLLHMIVDPRADPDPRWLI